MFQMLYNKVEVLSASTVSQNVKEVFEIMNVGMVLQVYLTLVITTSPNRPYLWSHPQRIHLSVDGWISPNTFSFLSIIVHQVQNGKLQSYILDFIKYVFYLTVLVLY